MQGLDFNPYAQHLEINPSGLQPTAAALPLPREQAGCPYSSCPYTSRGNSPRPRTKIDASAETGACVGGPLKREHGDTSCPGFTEGSSPFLSPCAPSSLASRGRVIFVAGVVPRRTLVAVTPCHLTGAAVRGHRGGRPPSCTPKRHLLPQHPLAAGSKQSHMPLFSSVKGICRLPLAYKSI